MSDDICQGKTLNDVFVQFNGVIRDSEGRYLGRLGNNVSYDNIVEEVKLPQLPQVHTLKTAPEYFKAIWNERKNFEIRKNDRDFKVGDNVRFLEFVDHQYTGRMVGGVITYITDYNQLNNHVVFGFKETDRAEYYEEQLQEAEVVKGRKYYE